MSTKSNRDRVLKKLRTLCLRLPEVSEGISFGNVAFRAGSRPFVVLDKYKGTECIFLYVDPGQRDELLSDKHFFKAPYDPREKGLCRSLVAIDWKEMKALIKTSYRQVAIKRMLRALDAMPER
jgi:predicted DNA-binding protein (MmcQ/YjbR family)